MTTPPAADPGTVLRDATAAMRQGNLPGAAALAAAAEARFRARGDADGRMRAAAAAVRHVAERRRVKSQPATTTRRRPT